MGPGILPATADAVIAILQAFHPDRLDVENTRASLIHGLICHVDWKAPDATRQTVGTIKFSRGGGVEVTLNSTFAGEPATVRKHLALCAKITFVGETCQRVIDGLSAVPLYPHSSERYQHYKGDVYEIDGIAAIEATGEPAVIYRRSVGSIGSAQRWVRPLNEFMGSVDGKPRFRLLRDDELNDEEG